MKRPSIALLCLALAACASPDNGGVANAVATPLNDLNLVRPGIPAVLAEARKGPYALPADEGCAALAAELRTLDEALGPDLDAPAAASDPGLVERGATAVGDAAVGTIKGAAEAVVPARSWVRRLTGADRHAREVAAAIGAGTARRAFLKGLRTGRGCS